MGSRPHPARWPARLTIQDTTMTRYVIRRLLILPFTLLGLSVLVFALLQLLDPGERAVLYVTSIPKTQQALDDIVHKYGLDQPIYVQYLNWLGRLAHGDLGWSKTAQQPVLSAIGQYFPATLELTLWSFLPIVLGGIWMGTLAAVHRDRLLDHLVRLFSIAGYAFPAFVFGLLMLMIFYAALQWFPPGRLSDWADVAVHAPAFHSYTGMYSLDALLNARRDIFVDAVRHLVLPALTLTYVNWALVLRVTRSAMLEVLQAEYMTVARAKGLPERYRIARHARPNALIPVFTVSGLLFAGLLNGAVLAEAVFDYHGIGWWAANAALNFDAVSVLGITLLDGALLILINLAVDIAYSYLDPRIRLS
jgi:peptide/nickel transport system permease protein